MVLESRCFFNNKSINYLKALQVGSVEGDLVYIITLFSLYKYICIYISIKLFLSWIFKIL